MLFYYGNYKEEYRIYYEWNDNIQMILKELGVQMMNWFELAQARDHSRALVNAALNTQVT